MAEQITTEKRIAILQDLMAGQDTRIIIAERHGISPATLGRLRVLRQSHPGKSLKEVAEMHTSQWYRSGNGKRRERPSKYAHLVPKIYSLQAKGLNFREIAEKLKISLGAVKYYIYGKKAKDRSKIDAVAVVPHTPSNGGTVNGGINKYVFVGIAVAENERLLRTVSERFGVNADFLRSGLSEFLEYQKVWGTPRPRD